MTDQHSTSGMIARPLFDSARALADPYEMFAAAMAAFRPLGVTIRTIKALAKAHICTVPQLAALTEAELAGAPGIGPSGLRQLKVHLRQQTEPTTAPLRGLLISVRFDIAALDRIDAWTQNQPHAMSRASAIRELVAEALRPGDAVQNAMRDAPDRRC